MSSKATVCPITREQFRKEARAIAAEIGGVSVLLDTKEFSTGSLGWFANQKITVTVGGRRVVCQLGLNLTVIGSKEAR